MSVILFVTAGGIFIVLYDLQKHLLSTRRVLAVDDKSPLRRGLYIAIGLAVLIVLTAGATIYLLWR
jgi:hypothetical protein